MCCITLKHSEMKVYTGLYRLAAVFRKMTVLNMLHAPLDSQHGGWGDSHLLEIACRKEKKRKYKEGIQSRGSK